MKKYVVVKYYVADAESNDEACASVDENKADGCIGAWEEVNDVFESKILQNFYQFCMNLEPSK